MRGVRQEVAQPLFALAPVPEGALDLRQHHVQRKPEPANLGLGIRRRDAAGEVAAGDLARHPADPLQRPQADTDHEPPEHDQRQDHSARHQRFDHDQPMQSVLCLSQRHRNHDRVATDPESNSAIALARRAR